MKITSLLGQIAQFEYTNYRGARGTRTLLVLGVQYGSNEYYPEPHFFLYGMDRDKGAMRSFAIDLIENLRIVA